MGNYFTKQNKLIILRGLPGSGKSTLAIKILSENPNGIILSSDDYFKKGNSFEFNPKKLRDAHAWNKGRAKKAFRKGYSPIIIDNCNIRKWEAQPYVEFGKLYEYEIEFIEADTPWKNNIDILRNKCQKNVPVRVFKRMLNDWENDFTVENVERSKAPWTIQN